jgi:hypothetical protein
MTLSPRSRKDSGAAAGASGWQNWGAEAVAIANNKTVVPPQPQTQGGGYGQQGRLAIEGPVPHAPFEDRANINATPDSIMSSRVGSSREPHQRSGRGSAQNSIHIGQYSKKRKKEKRAQGQSASNGRGGRQQENTHPCPKPRPSLSARSVVFITCSLCLVFLSWGLIIV